MQPRTVMQSSRLLLTKREASELSLFGSAGSRRRAQADQEFAKREGTSILVDPSRR
eukprot:m.364023 g.364023  ORF g.364023 m.364023 type:complete len:56 (+) comp56033_c1_seq12:810-977(+)